MEHITLTVEGMSCAHCVQAVTQALQALPGIGQVRVDLATKAVSVDYDPAKTTPAAMKTEIEDQGYDVVG